MWPQAIACLLTESHALFLIRDGNDCSSIPRNGLLFQIDPTFPQAPIKDITVFIITGSTSPLVTPGHHVVNCALIFYSPLSCHNILVIDKRGWMSSLNH